MENLKKGDHVILIEIGIEDAYVSDYNDLLGKKYVIMDDPDYWRNGFIGCQLKDQLGITRCFVQVKLKKASKKRLRSIIGVILLFLVLVSCVPFKRLEEPVRMNYAFNFYDDCQPYPKSLVCNDYQLRNDTLYLFKVGYSEKKLYQRAVADMIFPPDWTWFIVKLDGK